MTDEVRRWLGAVVAVLGGLAAGFLVVFVLLAAVPSTAADAVMTAASEHLGSDAETVSEYTARTLDGRSLDLHGMLSPDLSDVDANDPVVVDLSDATGGVTAVHWAGGDERTVTSTTGWVLAGLCAVAVVGSGALWWRWRSAMPRWLPAVAFVVPAVLVALLESGSAEIADTGRPVGGMGIYADTGYSRGVPLPAVVPLGATATAGRTAITVAGAPRPGFPDGAQPRLAALHGFTVAVRWNGPRTDRSELVGDGPGGAVLVSAPECGDPTPLSDTPGTLPVEGAGALCFVTPPGFTPRYLVVGAGSDGRAYAVTS